MNTIATDTRQRGGVVGGGGGRKSKWSPLFQGRSRHLSTSSCGVGGPRVTPRRRRRFFLILIAIWGFLVGCCWADNRQRGRFSGGGGSWSKVDKPKLYVAGFFPMNENETQGDLGRGVLPSVHLALDHINSNAKLLPNYYLDIFRKNTQCNAAVGMKAFFDMMFEPPPKLMLFGAACTQVTDPVAKTSKFWHLTQLSYADTHPMFSKQNYPNLFRVVPSENEFNAPRVELLRRFNWSIVGTLFQNEPRYALAHNKLLNDIDEASIQIKATQSFTDDLGNCLHKLKEQDVRIILGNFDEKWARRIFCEAYKLDMYGRKYQWIIVSMYDEHWWKISDQDVDCSQEQLMMAMEGYIATDLLPLRSNDIITYSGLTAQEYQREYDRSRNESYSRFHGYAYDGIWTVALAIQAVDRKLKRRTNTFALRDFRYRDRYWGQIFLDALDATAFEGVTGPVKFVNNDRQGYILLKQFQGGKEEKIGEYDGYEARLDLSKGRAISWRGGSTPPRDRTLIIIEPYRISITVYAVLATMASIGIVVATVFLAINIRFRNHRYIKMSSPYLNNLIIIGCILTYTSIILLGLDSELVSVQSLPYICTVRAWVLMAGFTLAFGSMFSKTWRVHAIFTNIKLNKKVIKDYQLFIVVGILLAIDLAIMTTWQVVDPFYRQTMRLKSYVHPSNEDMLIIPELEFCKSDKMTAFMVTVYAYKGLLMIIGCFLAWETRHVSIPALNDSKYIGMSVYNVVIMCVMGAAISFLLSEQQNAFFILISAFIIFCSTTTLCLVFLPKLVELKRNPNGSDKRSRTTFKPSTRRRYDSDDSNMQEKMKQLQEENQKCRKTLREKDLELQTLLKQLGENAQEIFGNSDIRDRSRGQAVRRSELMVRARNGEFVAVDEDMNSVISISSSPDGETTLTTMDTFIERKRPSFSSNLSTIMASTETIGTSAAKLFEAITFDPLPPIDDFKRNPDSIGRRGSSDEEDDDDEEEEEEEEHHHLRERDDQYKVQLLPERRTSEVTTGRRNNNSDSDDEADTKQCSVFTVSTGSPTLHLRRAFSWGRKGTTAGYLQMTTRRHQGIEGNVDCAGGGGGGGDGYEDVASAAGSWPNIARKSKMASVRHHPHPHPHPHPHHEMGAATEDEKEGGGMKSSKQSPKKTLLTFKRNLPRQISEKKRKENVATTQSYSSIKCDVVEYL